MPQPPKSNLHFDANEKQQVFTALDTLRNICEPKFAKLTTEERKRFGSVNEENKKIINKVKDYYQYEPNLAAPEVDWTEFLADYEDRIFLEFMLITLQGLSYDAESTKMVHDFDNLQSARQDYAYAKYRAEFGIAGASQKAKELAQFFAKNNPSKDKEKDKNNNNTVENEDTTNNNSNE